MKSNQILMMKRKIITEKSVNGYLYNWYTASDANMFPANCYLPEDTDLQTLSDYLGGDSVSGGHLKADDLIHWNSPNTSYADNSSDMSVYGSGIRLYDGTFNHILNYGFLWSITEGDAYTAQAAQLSYNDTIYLPFGNSKVSGKSIRVLYTGGSSMVYDYEGRNYDVITVGTQKWLKQNWACKYLNNGTPIPNVTNGASWAALTTLGYPYHQL